MLCLIFVRSERSRKLVMNVFKNRRLVENVQLFAQLSLQVDPVISVPTPHHAERWPILSEHLTQIVRQGFRLFVSRKMAATLVLTIEHNLSHVFRPADSRAC
jgi:hypothetical protein